MGKVSFSWLKARDMIRIVAAEALANEEFEEVMRRDTLGIVRSIRARRRILPIAARSARVMLFFWRKSLEPNPDTDLAARAIRRRRVLRRWTVRRGWPRHHSVDHPDRGHCERYLTTLLSSGDADRGLYQMREDRRLPRRLPHRASRPSAFHRCAPSRRLSATYIADCLRPA
jgi:hypothetical protein